MAQQEMCHGHARVSDPDVCNDSRYQLECIKVLDMFKREGWAFVKKSPGGGT